MTEGRGSSTTDPQNIPDDLRVPNGNVLLLRANDKGVQIYDCPVSDPPKTTLQAILLTSDSDEGDLVAIHSKGPTWQATDGSIVFGDATNAKHAAVLDPDGVNWLLPLAKSNAGNGLHSKVTYIQRLFTDGGNAPVGGCDRAQDQTQVLVEYSAQYLFYGPPA